MYVSSVSMNVLIKKSLHSNVMKRSSTETKLVCLKTSKIGLFVKRKIEEIY
jgi:hypothetical protein